jgi:hypothetical protein
MSNFKIGDKVLCIANNKDDKFDWGHIFPVIGEVYTIRAIYKSKMSVQLVEIINVPRTYEIGGYGECAFLLRRFIKWNPEALEDEIKEKEYAKVE